MASEAARAFLEAVMGKLFMVLENEYNKHKALVQEIRSLKQELRMIAAAMDDQLLSMGRSEARTAVARLHSEEMLDLEHDIEDSIDRFMHLLTCKHNRGGVRQMVHEVKKVKIRSSFAKEIQKFKDRLSEVRQRVVNQSAGSSSSTATAVSAPSRAARSLVGIGEPVEELLSLLDEVEGEPEQMRVISIVGFSGLGKTTLAKAVYDSSPAKKKFRYRAWVSAGGSLETSDWRGILRDVLQQVRPDDAMDMDGQHPEAMLKECLKDKMYLIEIDDIGMDQWRIISSAFENNGRGSGIILTTTIQSVANRCSHGKGYVYQMNTLGEQDSKELAFSGYFRSPELETGSASLLGKCDGLPLALVSVSDYLKSSSEPTGEQCAKLCRDLGSHLKGNHSHDNFSELRKVLLDNYDSLSGSALRCLLYLGIFPNNRPLKKKVIIRRLLAEGYTRSDDPRRSEEYNADDNFSKLIDRNIIQPVDTRNNSEVKTCKTHGVMHEFLLTKSLSQRFIATLPHDHPRLGSNINARHLSVHAGELTEWMASDEELSRLRSLTIFGDASDAISYIHKCKLIRVLDLQECNFLNHAHLTHICELWHLKYLSLWGNISELPRSIERLHCLETLDLRRTEIKFLPIEAIMLPHLAHLFGKFMLLKDDLNNVKKMSKLLKFFSSNKSNLQTLAGFINDEGKEFLQLIGHMKKLRKVKIWCKHVAGSSNYIADLSQAIQEFTKVPIEMDRVCSLSLDSEECSENFLSSLDMEPCSENFKYALMSLKLHGKLLRLPPSVILLSGLIELSISSATLKQDHLSALINLNRLLYLKLIAEKLENFEIKHGAFQSLRGLCFVVKNVASALPKIERGALPNLVSLQLLCQGLIGLSGIYIRHLKHLKEVKIDSKVTAQTRQAWEMAAKYHPNRPRVLLLGKVDPVESKEPRRPCAISEKRKTCVGQASSEDGQGSSLKSMRHAEPSSSSSRLQVIGHPHPVVVTSTEGASEPSMANL